MTFLRILVLDCILWSQSLGRETVHSAKSWQESFWFRFFFASIVTWQVFVCHGSDLLIKAPSSCTDPWGSLCSAHREAFFSLWCLHFRRHGCHEVLVHSSPNHTLQEPDLPHEHTVLVVSPDRTAHVRPCLLSYSRQHPGSTWSTSG